MEILQEMEGLILKHVEIQVEIQDIENFHDMENVPGYWNYNGHGNYPGYDLCVDCPRDKDFPSKYHFLSYIIV